jgi:hypothetical protein
MTTPSPPQILPARPPVYTTVPPRHLTLGEEFRSLSQDVQITLIITLGVVVAALFYSMRRG